MYRETIDNMIIPLQLLFNFVVIKSKFVDLISDGFKVSKTYDFL